MRLKGLLLALLMLVVATPAFAGEITIKGSTTVFPIMQKAIEAYMNANSGVNISLSGGGSSNGIKALLDGTTDIAMASRLMKDKEVAAAKDKGIEPVKHVVALDGVLPIIHPSNPVDNLTIEQLQGIFTGAITNWKDVGGNDESIVVISRDSSSGTYETWQEFVVGSKNKVTPRALLQASSGAVLQAVSKNPKAISYDGIGYVNETVKAPAVNGIKGTIETVKDGSFPVSRTLQVYTNGQPSGDIKAFLDYLLGAGQEHVTAAGFVKVN